ncbi:YbaK/EbsC family protein [Acetobacter sp. AN02]|uniref:YbaK/EbsC family protein n=1 Tax=Acetobacter sp. AN02 TaxID=2894186 RepID=UPI0024344929|nr:YbaK/EbsC family protein [Acetobacter sp. AN02]MDG6094493.1 YbaK/EbsC family protein [Acetobacter sp. AN02]
MSLESVRVFLAEHAPELEVIETQDSTATVEEAAAVHGVKPDQIAKTIAARLGDEVVLIVAAGTARLDNRKCKELFGVRPRMLAREEVEEITGHPVGGVCPFGVKGDVPVYCDVSLRDYAEVIPAGGSPTASVRLTVARLAEITSARWADLCKSG